MRLTFLLSLSLLTIALLSCELTDPIVEITDPSDPSGPVEDPTDSHPYVLTDVIVKTKSNYTINEVFDLINSLDHDVEHISSGVYDSDLPSDSLQYVLDYLNEKPYANQGAWKVTGYLHYQTQRITIFPRLFDIKNQDNQIDWLESMKILNLTEQGGYIIYFHVPEGKEMEWVNKFKTYDFIEWVEPNYYVVIEPHPDIL